MAVKINLMPKKEVSKADETSGRPLYFLLISAIFLISALIFAGIYYYNYFYLKKQLDTVEKKREIVQNEIIKSSTEEEFNEISAAIVKGKSIRSILSAHLYNSKIYDLLEKLTIKSVSYHKFTEKIGKDGVIIATIAGEADNYKSLAKQLMIFKKSKEIKDIVFKEASVEKNARVAFSVILSFDSKLIIAQPIINLIGPNIIKIPAGSNYSDAGATAIDGIDGTVAVTVSGSVDANTIGTYILTYTATNSLGNSAATSRTVKVVAPREAESEE